MYYSLLMPLSDDVFYSHCVTQVLLLFEDDDQRYHIVFAGEGRIGVSLDTSHRGPVARDSPADHPLRLPIRC